MLKQLIGAAALVLTAQGAASAQERLPDVTVPYGDLDLSKAADLKTFDRRLNWAVRSACPDERGVGRAKAARACQVAKRRELAPLRAQALAAASAPAPLVAAGR